MKLEFPSAVADPAPPPNLSGRETASLTTHIDIEPRGAEGLVLRGAGRELLGTEGRPHVISESRIEARARNDRVLTYLETLPPVDDLKDLEGRQVARGFRAAVDALLGAKRDRDAPLRQLLDDLPMAALISGYAALYSGKVEITPEHLRAGVLRPNICSGWRSDGTMLTTLEVEGHLPLPVGPPASTFEATDDPSVWHPMEPLRRGSMRRRRLIQVSRDRPAAVFAMFRDTHADSTGMDTVLHEYSFSASLDPDEMTLSRCVATPRVLPWRECPVAAASAALLDGLRPDELSSFVSEKMRGTSTCTHLNDLLRCLSAVDPLLVALGRA